MEIRKFALDSAADGLKLACIVCEPEGTVQRLGAVVLVHGMCEHKERYLKLMEYLSDAGYVCVISDLRGHGASVLSQNDLGFMYDGGWQAAVEDIALVVRWTKEHYPTLRTTLFGHSMGSLVVRSFAKRHDDMIDSLIVCGCPSDNPAKTAGKALAKAIGLTFGWHSRPGLLQTMSFGAYNKPFSNEPYKSAWVCSDRQILEEYHSDPLCQYVFTANGFYNLMGLMQDCYGIKGWKVMRPQMPVHFISGAQDPCRISDEALAKAVDSMKKAGYTNVSLKIYPNMRHEIHNETLAPQTVWPDIVQMLEK
ncbi:MAG: alpha/beta fold hydrolase [Bacteroidales bacterium]|nr:alpha/beta fold hydrolase [Candidatus Cacconaster merdequi]